MNAAPHETPELVRERLSLAYTCFVPAGTAVVCLCTAYATYFESLEVTATLVGGTFVAQVTAASIAFAWMDDWFLPAWWVWLTALIGLLVSVLAFGTLWGEQAFAWYLLSGLFGWCVMQFALQQVPLRILRYRYGIKLRPDDRAGPTLQFGVRHLLMVTAVVGLFLAVRVAALQNPFRLPPWLWILLPPVGSLALGVVALLRRRAFLTSSGVILVLMTALPPLPWSFNAPNSLEQVIALNFWVMSVVTASWMLIFALPLRLGGYRVYAVAGDSEI